MRNSFEFSKKVVEEKSTYRDKISQAYETEYRILEKNLELATSEEERQEIRRQMADIRDSAREESKDFNQFADNIQKEQHDHTLKILTSMAVVAGLVKFRKPLLDFGKNLLQLKA